jgi:Fur family iron response transcriptional regulator
MNTILNRTEAINSLRNHGILPTHQRLVIMQYLLAKRQHISAEQLKCAIQQELPDISVATIYNTLKIFQEKGLIQSVHVDNQSCYYDSYPKPHHHFYRVDTHELIDIDPDQIQFSQLPPIPEGMCHEATSVVLRIQPKEIL